MTYMHRLTHNLMKEAGKRAVSLQRHAPLPQKKEKTRNTPSPLQIGKWSVAGPGLQGEAQKTFFSGVNVMLCTRFHNPEGGSM